MVFISSRSLTSLGLSVAFATRLSAGTSLLTFTTFRRAAIKATAFLYFLISLGACFLTQGVASERVPFVTIDQGFRSGVRERKFLVIKTEPEWKAVWQSHGQPLIPVKELPRVDFDKEMVVAVFVGEKPTGGYKVEMTSIEEEREKGRLRIVLRESKPPVGSIAIQALTQPYQILRVKKTDLTTTFVTEP